ncbi:molybdopterin-dependent oxidoreductase [Nocardia brasiliensis]|uniref:molybdopterin-dependent oxidoreductase n=2 Tax=Nocardia brasiliensis TaxID=37326 RepID=UPI002456471B|nr:molybdopterin-dependent oxidoreductase [Nocardia brasiliensis]
MSAEQTRRPEPEQSAGPAADAWHKSACILCECNCGIEIKLDDRKLSRIRGDKEHPASGGYTCEKALRLDFYQNGRHRITAPLRRRDDGTYEEITWETAISEIAAKLLTVRREYGGDKIFFYGGGGQGNHLGGAYGKSLMAALGAKYYSNALAQEKTGEMWVDGKLYGGHTKGDFEHAEVVLFLGKNPWQSHSFPRARPTLKAIVADPQRAMIVIDPRRSETAEMADFHLQVRPGTDAWCVSAMLAVLVEEDLLDHEFLREHTTDVAPVLAALATIPVAEFAAHCGVPEDLLRNATRRFAAAGSATTYEDLGIQQAPHSTLVSYLNKLLWILTGNFGRPGTMYLHSTFAAVAGTGGAPKGKPASGVRKQLKKATSETMSRGAAALSALLPTLASAPVTAAPTRRLTRTLLRTAVPTLAAGLGGLGGGSAAGGKTTPVTGARIIAGLVPANSITEEILTDHPDRFRAIWIDSSNPVHSLANSERMRAAMRSLELSVVIDVAMTETARVADYVLPASSQFEKWESTFFNVEFPHNTFQLRPPVLTPLPGTRAESDIYTGVVRALGLVDPALVDRLVRARKVGKDEFALTFFSAVAGNPALMNLAPYLLHEALGPHLPAGAANAATLWGAAHLCAFANPAAVRRAGFTGTGIEPGEQLFEAVLTQHAGVTFTVDTWDDVWAYVKRRDRRFTVHIPELLAELDQLRTTPPAFTTAEYPFTLSAGERRSFTANTIIRNPEWRRRGGAGELRISPADARELALDDGARVAVVTETGRATAIVEISAMMQQGHISLPNGMGLDTTDGSGQSIRTGVAVNELTSVERRDRFAGTPWHKNVPARIEPVRD